MDTTYAIIIIALIIGGFALLFVFVARRMQRSENVDGREDTIALLNQNLQNLQAELSKTTQHLQSEVAKSGRDVSTKLQEQQRELNTRLDNAARVIAGVQHELGGVKEIGRGIKELQDFMRSPKLRGNIGEQVLKDLLEQYLPQPQFAFQHKFQEGQIVDAIIKTDKGLIPVDAKFPMENFLRYARAESDEEKESAVKEFVRDVKKHIGDIARKYILPAEGTVDFAIMYVPNEVVYYEIIRAAEDLNAYAYEKKVFLVSPNSFYYFLKVIMIGMEGKRIEEATKQILETLQAIKQDSVKFGENLDVLTRHVGNAKNALDRVNTDYTRLSGKIDQVRLLK